MPLIPTGGVVMPESGPFSERLRFNCLPTLDRTPTYFGSSCDLLWSGLRLTLDRTTTYLGSNCDLLGTELRPTWDRTSTYLGSNFDLLGIRLRPIWDRTPTYLGSGCDLLGMAFRPAWDRAATYLGCFGMRFPERGSGLVCGAPLELEERGPYCPHLCERDGRCEARAEPCRVI